MNLTQINILKIIPQSLNHTRLDIALSTLLPEYSRSIIQKWIKQKHVLVDKKLYQQKDLVFAQQQVEIVTEIQSIIDAQPQQIYIDVIYEDQDIIIINKQPGLIVHPGAGNYSGTLLNALLFYYPDLSKLPRCGIIHRLDKDTSGLMVIAKNIISYCYLTNALQKKLINREYEAIVIGNLISGGTINAPMGRHSTQRTLMAVRTEGKIAVTHYRIIKRFLSHTHIKVILETGRTHQIRVHLAYIGNPIVGDQSYNTKNQSLKNYPLIVKDVLINFKRQALHACKLSLCHPKTNKLVEWNINPPKDMQNLLTLLNKFEINLANKITKK